MVDFSLVIDALLKVWWLIPVALLVVILKSPRFKGAVGEFLVRLAAKVFLPARTYHPINNVTLQSQEGTTQIDHVFVSRYGIFVVETKNMKGWIFGGEKQAQWTQKLYRKSFKFQNPLRQNYKHVKAMESLLDAPPETIHSVVVFAGDSEFKTPMPSNVKKQGAYIKYIRSFREEVLDDRQVKEAIERIQAGRLEPNRETHRKHVEHLKAKATLAAEKKCPKCGSDMVLRAAKKGTYAGKRFWGCSSFPKCRVMLNVT